ncbi:MAG: vWA domain-containing protein [Planctomycetota bacterium]|jgi:hypothetical protein
MPYKAEISSASPSCFLFLIDQSTSMAEEISAGEATQQKSTGVANTMNKWLQELSIKCSKSDGVRDYYHVGVIGYGMKVQPCMAGSNGHSMIPISEIANNPQRVEGEEGAARIPVWFDAVADGGTPMCRAVAEAEQIIEGWLEAHPDGFPPIVIHVTDGEATDGDPTDRLHHLTNMASSDGNVMLFNIHLSAHPGATPISFPDSPEGLPDEYSRMLFDTASPLTPTMRALAKEYGIETSDRSRGFVLNADMTVLVQAIDIGTRPSNLR